MTWLAIASPATAWWRLVSIDFSCPTFLVTPDTPSSRRLLASIESQAAECPGTSDLYIKLRWSLPSEEEE